MNLSNSFEQSAERDPGGILDHISPNHDDVCLYSKHGMISIRLQNIYHLAKEVLPSVLHHGFCKLSSKSISNVPSVALGFKRILVSNHMYISKKSYVECIWINPEDRLHHLLCSDHFSLISSHVLTWIDQKAPSRYENRKTAQFESETDGVISSDWSPVTVSATGRPTKHCPSERSKSPK
jgi:hypothetical protein